MTLSKFLLLAALALCMAGCGKVMAQDRPPLTTYDCVDGGQINIYSCRMYDPMTKRHFVVVRGGVGVAIIDDEQVHP